MTSLSEAYRAGTRHASHRRLYAGIGLFLTGALLVVLGILASTTNFFVGPEAPLWQARELGITLGGLGVPAVFLGIFAVLPAGRQTRFAAVVGALVTLAGVALFWEAYPCQWSGATCGGERMDLTLPTVGLYFLGSVTTFWCLFAGVANFKTRNDPGGTVRMEITRQGETRIVEVERSAVQGLGGVGLLGATPDGEVETQTNQPREESSVSTVGGASKHSSRDRFDTSETDRSSGWGSTGNSTVSDGGATDSDIYSPLDDPVPGDAEVLSPETPSRPQRPKGDSYCGSCAHFQYVRTEGGMRPYCHRHSELMDDMAACDEWTSRNDDGR
ncbi:YihY/virulence factor BrkB family protein [Haloprofundus halobius]|uniref:YihY/virulence factor BrkB family protein n=1 Tax=Haloprofundus halobius TaxID=2876194 RepID=UPI001CCE898A|nr:YihY/virulence factor BrkB family protein [Haloprofundus halobius]